MKFSLKFYHQGDKISRSLKIAIFVVFISFQNLEPSDEIYWLFKPFECWEVWFLSKNFLLRNCYYIRKYIKLWKGWGSSKYALIFKFFAVLKFSWIVEWDSRLKIYTFLLLTHYYITLKHPTMVAKCAFYLGEIQILVHLRCSILALQLHGWNQEYHFFAYSDASRI